MWGKKKKLKVEFEIAGNLKLLPHERDDPWRTETPPRTKDVKVKSDSLPDTDAEVTSLCCRC